MLLITSEGSSTTKSCTSSPSTSQLLDSKDVSRSAKSCSKTTRRGVTGAINSDTGTQQSFGTTFGFAAVLHLSPTFPHSNRVFPQKANCVRFATCVHLSQTSHCNQK